MTSKTKHLYELDSLRGLAALTVVLRHFSLVLPLSLLMPIVHSPLRILTAGHSAVLLFFLLSGLVLTLPYIRTPDSSYRAFIVKRICRIYLPYLVALALAIAGDFLFAHPVYPAGSDSAWWLNLTWASKPAWPSVMQHIAFIGDYDPDTYNTAFWSLIYEFRISLVFPFVIVAILRMKNVTSLAIAVALSVSCRPLAMAFASVFHKNFADPSFERTYITLHYLAIFMVGALLAKNMGLVRGYFERLGRTAIVLLTCVALFCYTFCEAGIFGDERVQDWVGVAGAVWLIVLALNASGFRSFLHRKLLHHLGKISYSLYLVHAPVLFTLVHFYFGRMPFIYLLPGYLIISVLLAEAFYRLIELPTLNLGRKLGAAVSLRLAAPVPIAS